jgi:tRNA nucleotidyltransferase (CCA-adding enzyme)
VVQGTLHDDLFRRDFTINAMAVALNPPRFGELIDPFGGREDLRDRLLRVLHPRSFIDDPSRILRGIRFAQRFGCQYHQATRHLLEEALAAGALGWLNAGRLRKELDRMLEEPNPLACLRQLWGLLEPGQGKRLGSHTSEQRMAEE